MGAALGRLADEDPTFRVRATEETGQTLIDGMGEPVGAATVIELLSNGAAPLFI